MFYPKDGVVGVEVEGVDGGVKLFLEEWTYYGPGGGGAFFYLLSLSCSSPEQAQGWVLVRKEGGRTWAHFASPGFRTKPPSWRDAAMPHPSSPTARQGGEAEASLPFPRLLSLLPSGSGIPRWLPLSPSSSLCPAKTRSRSGFNVIKDETLRKVRSIWEENRLDM